MSDISEKTITPITDSRIRFVSFKYNGIPVVGEYIRTHKIEETFWVASDTTYRRKFIRFWNDSNDTLISPSFGLYRALVRAERKSMRDWQIYKNGYMYFYHNDVLYSTRFEREIYRKHQRDLGEIKVTFVKFWRDDNKEVDLLPNDFPDILISAERALFTGEGKSTYSAIDEILKAADAFEKQDLNDDEGEKWKSQ